MVRIICYYLIIYSFKNISKESVRYSFRLLLNEKVVPVNHSLCDIEEPYFCPFQDFDTIMNDISTEKLLPCTYGDFCSESMKFY